jgi:hypothetical protein
MGARPGPQPSLGPMCKRSDFVLPWISSSRSRWIQGRTTRVAKEGFEIPLHPLILLALLSPPRADLLHCLMVPVVPLLSVVADLLQRCPLYGPGTSDLSEGRRSSPSTPNVPSERDRSALDAANRRLAVEPAARPSPLDGCRRWFGYSASIAALPECARESRGASHPRASTRPCAQSALLTVQTCPPLSFRSPRSSWAPTSRRRSGATVRMKLVYASNAADSSDGRRENLLNLCSCSFRCPPARDSAASHRP